MYAKEENGTIKKYIDLPNSFGNVVGGYYKLDLETHKADGFYPYQMPTVAEYQKITDIYFDADNEIFTHDVIDFTDEEIAEFERSKIPNTITRMNLKIQLLLKGISIDYIIGVINSLDSNIFSDIQKQIAIIKLNEAQYFERENSDFQMIAQICGLTENDLDEMFTNGNENII